MQHSAPARNWVGDNGKIIEPLFSDYFLSLHPMRCFQGRLFTVDGMIENEAPLKKEIYEQVRYYATTSVCLLYTSPRPRDRTRSRMPSSA